MLKPSCTHTERLVLFPPCVSDFLETVIPDLGAVKAFGVATLFVEGLDSTIPLLRNLLASLFQCLGHAESFEFD